MNIAIQRRPYPRTIHKKKPSKLADLKDCTGSVGSINLNQTRLANAISYSASISKRIQIMTKISAIESTALFVAIALVVLLASIVSIECHIKRTQYHEQGLHGPKSYKFGYTSGDHKNPQERHEVSDGHGHVKGWYSFVDANGKYQVVHYEAHPKYGFTVHNHKSKAYNNGKRHYGS